MTNFQHVYEVRSRKDHRGIDLISVRKSVRLTVVIFLGFIVPAIAFAGPLEEGKAAQQRGDYSAALKLLQPLADQGNAEAESEIANLYESGTWNSRDEAEALKWYLNAGNHGDKYAQLRLGTYYEWGMGGLKKDDTEAAKWYRKSAEQGQPWAQLVIGSMYEEGRGVPKDAAEAAKWLRLSSIQGTEGAQERLSRLYAKGGPGLEKSYLQSLLWTAYPYRYWYIVSMAIAVLIAAGMSVKSWRPRTLFLISLFGRLVVTVCVLTFGLSEVLCIRHQSPMQTAVLNVLAISSVLAFASYWLLYAWMSAAKFREHKCSRLFLVGVVLSISRIAYMTSLCGH